MTIFCIANALTKLFILMISPWVGNIANTTMIDRSNAAVNGSSIWGATNYEEAFLSYVTWPPILITYVQTIIISWMWMTRLRSPLHLTFMPTNTNDSSNQNVGIDRPKLISLCHLYVGVKRFTPNSSQNFVFLSHPHFNLIVGINQRLSYCNGNQNLLKFLLATKIIQFLDLCQNTILICQ